MKREGEMNKPHLNQNLIKLLLKSFIHFCGVKLNTIDPMMLIKFMIKNSTQDHPENNHKIIFHLIYTLKKVFKMFFKREKYQLCSNYSRKIKTIEKSEMNSNIFIKILVIF